MFCYLSFFTKNIGFFLSNLFSIKNQQEEAWPPLYLYLLYLYLLAFFALPVFSLGRLRLRLLPLLFEVKAAHGALGVVMEPCADAPAVKSVLAGQVQSWSVVILAIVFIHVGLFRVLASSGLRRDGQVADRAHFVVGRRGRGSG